MFMDNVKKKCHVSFPTTQFDKKKKDDNSYWPSNIISVYISRLSKQLQLL